MMATFDGTGSGQISSNGHFFAKKNFHRPTYCHHCTDMVWGLLQQGYICEVCNFIAHDRCRKDVFTYCSTIAASLVPTPVGHCWSDTMHLRKKFCNVCRKRLEDTPAVRCQICAYCVHVECTDFAVPNCKKCSTFIPDRGLGSVTHTHHWREGNLPPSSKCAVCKRSCWTSECLSSLRCKWCGTTVHSTCCKQMPSECWFGVLESIMLPPQAVSIPRIDVPMEAILGVQSHRKDTLSPRSISEDFSSCDLRCKDEEDEQMKKKDDDDEMIKLYDGNSGLRRRLFRTVIISKRCTLKQLLTAALKTFHILQDPGLYCLVDAYAAEERDLEDPNPVEQLMKREGKRPAAFLRYKAASHAEGHIEVHPSQLNVSNQTIRIKVTDETTVKDVIFSALSGLSLDQGEQGQYQLSKVTLDKGAVSERVMGLDEQPWEQLKADSRDSIRIMELTRFYVQKIEDPHGPNIALYVGNLPKDYKQLQYEALLEDFLGKDNKYQSIGPIYYEYGSLVITYSSSEDAVRAFYSLRDTVYEDKNLLVLLLPTISPSMIPSKVVPLLVFVNAKSGGCQGNELIQSFRKLLNPYQVFDLDNGGPLPGLYVFRNISDYKILCCGGDGTVGWVLQCLDNVGQDSECCSPPCAIVPLGTGNDLARVLHWGAGYTGSEDPLSLLRDVIDAEDISLDRWTVVFHTDEKITEERPIPVATPAQLPLGTQNEDNTQIFIMNNYFGIGIDADLCLDFHNAREENPNKFNSRLRNKGVYVKMGLRKMVSPKMCKDLHREITLDVDGKSVELPALEGLIVLNILSWGSGANPWGPEKEDGFNKPNHWDGALEVVGVTGVMHLGQIQSGLRSAIRIAQAGHIRIRVKHDVPVQVDGEPWIQSQGEIIIMKSALRATMMKKQKGGRMKRRNTEPTMSGGLSIPSQSTVHNGESPCNF